MEPVAVGNSHPVVPAQSGAATRDPEPGDVLVAQARQAGQAPMQFAREELFLSGWALFGLGLATDGLGLMLVGVVLAAGATGD